MRAPGTEASGTRRIARRAVAIGSALVATVVAVVALVALLTSTFLFAGHSVLSAAPELPEAPVDVSELGDLSEAVSRTTSRSSVVLDAGGSVIGRFKPEEYHEPMEVGEVPEIVEDALLAAEDDRFREHAGYDAVAIGRALGRNLTSGTIAQGGSTLTQQLAKNLFTDGSDELERKLDELSLAIELEEQFTKDEILTAYANSVFLANGNYGFEAAARDYFDKPAAELTLSEAALLVGILPAPSERDPRSRADEAEAAWREVLARVRGTGRATEAEVDAALAAIPEVLPARPAIEAFPYYLDYVRRYLLDVEKVDPELLYGGGLVIETALDPQLQTAAEQAVLTHLPDPAGPDAALAVVDVDTGLVSALVGGRSFEEEQVNLALGRLGGGSGRQAGSSFKPFVLAEALRQGYVTKQTIGAPAEYLPTTVDDPKPVRNFSNRGYGPLSLTEATVRSVNTTFVALTEVVGAGAVRDLAERLGVDGLPKGVGPSVGIGAYETSPLSMTAAYASLAADGRRVETSPVRRVLDADGEIVADFTPRAGATREAALEPDVARRVTTVLEANVRRGTATRTRIGRPSAAKTGTSDEYANAWLAGYTRDFAAAVWVGYADGNIPMRNVTGVARVTGGSIPALIWRDVMAVAHRDRPVRGFPAPAPEGEPVELLPGHRPPPPPKPDPKKKRKPDAESPSAPSRTTEPSGEEVAAPDPSD